MTGGREWSVWPWPAAVVLYDGLLKRTPFGPLGMGACRLLNVLLGMSLAAGPWGLFHGQVALAVGTYITGVTWFARSEATESRPVGSSPRRCC